MSGFRTLLKPTTPLCHTRLPPWPPAHPNPCGSTLPAVPAGVVLAWFVAAVSAAAETFRRLAKADNTRSAYRAAVRAWCDWCDWCARHGLSPLPAVGPNVAAFLAAERRRGLTPPTIELRRAAIRYRHRATYGAVPADDACVCETVAGIRRDAAAFGLLPARKRTATGSVIDQLLAAIVILQEWETTLVLSEA